MALLEGRDQIVSSLNVTQIGYLTPQWLEPPQNIDLNTRIPELLSQGERQLYLCPDVTM